MIHTCAHTHTHTQTNTHTHTHSLSLSLSLALSLSLSLPLSGANDEDIEKVEHTPSGRRAQAVWVHNDEYVFMNTIRI